MLTEITLESGCKSTTFYNTIQIIQKENSKKSNFFTPQIGKSTTRTISPIYIIQGEKKKMSHNTRFIKNINCKSTLSYSPAFRNHLNINKAAFTPQKLCNQGAKTILLQLKSIAITLQKECFCQTPKNNQFKNKTRKQIKNYYFYVYLQNKHKQNHLHKYNENVGIRASSFHFFKETYNNTL